jgi:hypothetical protein
MANNVVIVVTADGSQAIDVAKQLEAAFEKTGHKIGEQTPHVTSLTDELGHMGPAGKVGSSAIEDLANVLTSRLGFASKGASAGIEELLGSLGGAGGSALVAGAGIAALAGTALVATEVAKKSTEVFVSQAESVRHLSELTGASAQQSSVLSATMRDLGVGTDVAAVAFGRMSIAIQKGTLEKYGIDVKRASDGSIDFNAVLKQVAAQFESNTNVTARNAEMTAIFGRGWQALLPLLSQGAEGVQKLEDAAAQHTFIYSQEDLDNAKKFEIAQNQLSDAITNAWAQIGSQIAPALTTLAQDITVVVDGANHLIKAFDDLTKSSGGLGGILNNVLTVMNPIQAAILNFTNAQLQSATATQAATNALRMQGEAAQTATTDIKLAADAARQYAQDQMSAAQADARVSDVQTQWAQKVADAEARKANDIKAAQAGVAAAQQNLVTVEEQSAQSIVAAKDRVRQAEEKLRQDSQVDVQSARTVADAKLNLARVEQDIASGRLTGVDATRAYEDATTNLSRTQDDAATKEAQRQQQIADDQAAVTKAKQDETRAEVQAARDIANARTQITNAVTALNKAEHEVTITVADRTRHELELRSALLSQSLAHERVRTDIATMTQEVRDHKIAWSDVEAELNRLHVTTFPNIIADLVNVKKAGQEAVIAMGSANTPGEHSGSRVNDLNGSGNTFQGGGGGSFTANVTINGVIADKNAANTIGAAVADGVHKQFLRWQNSGQSLGFGSKH